MRLTESVIAVWACLAQVQIAEAALAFTQWPTAIYTGVPTTLKWETDSDAPVKVTLRKGAAQDLDTVKVLTAEARDGSFTWTPDDTVEDGDDYAFQIQQDGQVNYTGLLKVSNPNPPASTTSATTAISSTTAPLPSSSSVTTTQDASPTQTQTTPSPTPTDTAPRDETDSVTAGTTGLNVTDTDESTSPSSRQSNMTSGKSALAAAMESGGASFRLVSADLLLGAVAMVFYLAY
ncbi:hypothetical protein BO70DRAFT_377654 [Aspergillus heteromorphus CBS 117.55]|uniref:Yeast cell wall synthesis Kre9/Knh1-like N-terminal domain-containing protein n=1 Tax=Aspergillus heteromorphus CBS 117.55 TaxID=1448321 RepID=A0A317WTX9_9EURO|nr:uncharacterized protein BO70DRAFT_377654 [Aspergillus heteromorphus CBS 117.55]PWY89271.1 hypothetical protein BO70DRAFT_377654 [Aspergillus heteromorphus CBS 117.55]